MFHIQVLYELAPTSLLLGGLPWPCWYILATLLLHGVLFFLSNRPSMPPAGFCWDWIHLWTWQPAEVSRLKGYACCHAGKDSSSIPLREEAPAPKRKGCAASEALRFQGRPQSQIPQDMHPRSLFLVSGSQVFLARGRWCNRSALAGNVRVLQDLDSNYQALYLPLSWAAFIEGV